MKLYKVDDKYVNLEKVANVNCLSDKYVFNMSYSVKIENVGRISDYVYVKSDSFMKSDYFKDNFIEVSGIDRRVFINVNHISQIRKDVKNSKIIFSFCHDVNGRNIMDFEFVAEHMYIKVNPSELDYKFDHYIKVLNSF